MGYATIGTVQAILVVCLFLSLPLWKKFEVSNEADEEAHSDVKVSTLIKLPGAKPALISFFCYCAIELTTGLWASSLLVTNNGLSAESAAKWVSLYYLGITVGRFLSGFIAMKLNNKQMIRMGQVICIMGAALLIMPIHNNLQLAGLVLIGLGCAPIYPAMLHETPNRFGKELSQGIMGIQMATAYVGSNLVLPLFGALSRVTGFGILPYFLLILMIIMLLSSERVSKVCEKVKVV